MVAIENADQAELQAVLNASASASSGVLDDRILGTIDEGDLDVDDPLAHRVERDAKLDELVGASHEEIERRIHWLGDNYPFRIDNNTLIYSPTKSGIYEFCLALSTLPSLTTGSSVELVRFFEVIAAEAFRAFLGGDSDYIRTGAPAINYPKAGANFKDSFETIHKITKEWRWDPDEDALKDLPTIQDEGIDFVVWKMLDERQGSLFILGQCSCGKSDWHEKYDDIDADFKRIERWFRNGARVKPVRAFAVPFPITTVPIFSRLTDLAGLTMDRIRLSKLAESEEYLPLFKEHSKKIQSLSQIVMPNFAFQPD